MYLFRRKSYSAYNLNYTPTTLGVQGWREITSGVQERLNTIGLHNLINFGEIQYDRRAIKTAEPLWF
jgi:hypothetical protein